MPYEIPQQLQYEEKIVFGLTFSQLGYALLFGIPALILCMKTSINIYAKILITAILLGIAVLFMFLNFSSFIRNFMVWMKFRKATIMDDKMIQFLGIEKIQNGVLYVWRTKKPTQERK